MTNDGLQIKQWNRAGYVPPASTRTPLFERVETYDLYGDGSRLIRLGSEPDGHCRCGFMVGHAPTCAARPKSVLDAMRKPAAAPVVQAEAQTVLPRNGWRHTYDSFEHVASGALVGFLRGSYQYQLRGHCMVACASAMDGVLAVEREAAKAAEPAPAGAPFKAGDRVRCVNADALLSSDRGRVELNGVYHVTSVDPDGYHVGVNGSNLSVRRFVLVQS